MAFNALLPIYGCKRMQSKGIIEAIGDHNAYFEPFAGSMAVLLAKNPCRMEVVNDLHGGIVNLAKVVQDDHLSIKLFEKLNRTVFSESLYDEAVNYLMACEDGDGDFWSRTELSHLELAYRYFIVSWMGRNGLIGTDKELDVGFCKRFTSNGGDPATRFRNAVANIPSWWGRLQGVTILNEDAFKLIERIEDKAGTAIYVDPPYLKKSAKYKCELSKGQHEELATLLSRFKASKVVVSYYREPELDNLFTGYGFNIVDKTTTKQMTNGKTEAPEVLYVKNAA